MTPEEAEIRTLRNLCVVQEEEVAALKDALVQIRKALEGQSSALAKAIIATCNSALRDRPENILSEIHQALDRF